MKNTYVIVEDHLLFAQALQGLIAKINNWESLGIFTDTNAIAEKLSELKPKFLFLDLNLPGSNGIDLISILKSALPKMKIIVVTMCIDPLVITKAINAGVNGYLPKNTSFDELSMAMNLIEGGGFYLNPIHKQSIAELENVHLSNDEINTNGKLPTLTARELDILKLLALGYSTPMIAEKLFLSPHTIKTHRHNILDKLGFKNSTSLVKFATEIGLI
ncbi:MAG: response regulator transcription factor [Bacteroidia bacterium]|nr:response regulator transcription factor [Bacteroidia bacterium]